MIRVGIGLAVALAAAIGFSFTPTATGAGMRRALAVKAVQSGMPALGVALLTPLSDAGDAAAQNNLAVLLNRGIGVSRDPVKAAQLFNAAANAGLPRAQLNLTMIRTPCDTQYLVQTVGKLESFARLGDRRAASFIADCLVWSPTAFPFAEGTRRMLEAAAIATKPADADEELKFGWLLMLRTKQAEGWGMDAARRDAAQASARYLLRAAEHGRPAAYEGLSLLRQNALKFLSGMEAAAVSAKQPDEWIDLAAREGHPKSRCGVGTRLATEIAQRPAAVNEEDKQRFHDYFNACARGHNPRQIILLDGKEQTLGHDPLFDIWMRDDPFLVTAPRYENYDYDNVARDDALSKMTRLMDRRSR